MVGEKLRSSAETEGCCQSKLRRDEVTCCVEKQHRSPWYRPCRVSAVLQVDIDRKVSLNVIQIKSVFEEK
jgi:hypothetical protein